MTTFNTLLYVTTLFDILKSFVQLKTFRTDEIAVDGCSMDKANEIRLQCVHNGCVSNGWQDIIFTFYILWGLGIRFFLIACNFRNSAFNISSLWVCFLYARRKTGRITLWCCPFTVFRTFLAIFADAALKSYNSSLRFGVIDSGLQELCPWNLEEF
jgi:hypothetical protein